MFIITGRGKLPSVSDDAVLEEDIDHGSEVTAATDAADSGIMTSESQTAGSSVISDSSKGCDSRSLEDDEDLVKVDVNDIDPDHALDPDQRDTDNVSEQVMVLQESMTTDDDYTNIEIGDLSDDRAISQSSSMDTLSEAHNSPKLSRMRKAASIDCASVHSSAGVLPEEFEPSEPSVNDIPGLSNAVREGDIGCLLGDDLPLLYCARVLCSKFLLSGYRHGLIPDQQIRVSIKALALGCTGSIVAIHPTVLLEKLHKSSPVPG